MNSQSFCRAARHLRVLLVVALGIALLPTGAAGAAEFAAQPANTTTVYVAANGDPRIARWIVTAIGGQVLRDFDVTGTFVADVPTANLPILSVLPQFIACAPTVSASQRQKFSSSAYDAATDPYSLKNIATAIGADGLVNAGYTGAGIDVALIDTGVAPVGPLASPSVVHHGPDLSFDSQTPALAHNDTYGHGTHMAGIINAVAPGSRIVSLKVGDKVGSVDVTQIIAAVDWVREHKNDYGLNIRVLNLSYGIASTNAWTSDELSLAVDAAWKAGIVVVVSAGNGGRATSKYDPGVLTPAYNKNVLAVAAYDTGADSAARTDDVIPPFTSGSSSSNKRMPDVAAPGQSIASYRVPGSAVDEQVSDAFCKGGTDRPYPIVNNGALVRGSGTSQAAAAASGAVALWLSKYPTLTGPGTADIVKKAFRLTGASVVSGSRNLVGEGAIDLARAAAIAPATLRDAAQNFDTVVGAGSLYATRNGDALYDEQGFARSYAEVYASQYAKLISWGFQPVIADALAKPYATSFATSTATLNGDKDIFGKPFSPAAHAAMLRSGQQTWTDTPEGQMWNGSVWTGAPVPGSGFGSDGWVRSAWRDANWIRSAWRESEFVRSAWRDGAWVRSSWRDGGWVRSSWRDGGWVRSSWRDGGWAGALWE